MSNLFFNYIQSVSSKFAHKETSEMGYRSDFETLIRGVFESINVKRIDHDAKATKGNKPDFIVLKNDIPILYIEAKDIGVSLDKVEKSEQMARYYGYANLVLTDYVEFRFYRNGVRYENSIKIANYNIEHRTITPIPESYEHVTKTLVDFAQSHKEPIKSGKHLSQIMGGKAQRIRDNVRQIFSSDLSKESDITRVYDTIKTLLVHDLTPDTFADMYAQTLVYGLFVARYYDDPETFSRQTARDLIPASNPFLRHFFDHIAGLNFENRLKYIVDELCEVFKHANTKELMGEYFKKDAYVQEKGGSDPVIHFYEDFLNEYDPILRKKMGAYYTPLPVVKFIIRAVDQILEKDFGLSRGLADTSKNTDGIHRVQILDPAVGTGTFLSEIIGTIYERILKSGQKGSWGQYVHNELLPRLYGFELMMAPYTIAHLKLSMALKESGFMYFNETRSGKARLGIYLTNSLEDVSKQPELLAFDFAASIAEEAKEASKIKNEKPIMIVVGNPPYSGESSNNFESANRLIDKYKFEPGGIKKLKERNPKWLNDDYVKFIAFAEGLIDKNGEGILGYITNHAYLDNPTFRGMRWKLASTFDDIYIIDLHGNTKKKEISPDGTKDENVFNIMQGVAIIIGVKKKHNKDKIANVYHADIYGVRDKKFKVLEGEIDYKKIDLDPKYYFFVPKNIAGQGEYEDGFLVTDILVKHSAGIITGNDTDFIKFDKNSFNTDIDQDNIKDYLWRIFDFRYINYDQNIIGRSRIKIMQHFVNKNNLGLTFVRGDRGVRGFSHVFLSKTLVDGHLHPGLAYSAPLYLYSENGSKVPNLKKEIVNEIEKSVGKVSPEDIFDYIYAVLHSPSYREKYKEFLKIDFPRVPYPKDKETFKKLVSLGQELRLLHLLESPRVSKFITSYPESGSDMVEKITYKDGRVFINTKQYFGNVPEVAWSFWIGGYQPAQKWLKDRKGRTLNNEDIEHYQKIIVALTETDRIMKEIDKEFKL